MKDKELYAWLSEHAASLALDSEKDRATMVGLLLRDFAIAPKVPMKAPVFCMNCKRGIKHYHWKGGAFSPV